MIRTFSALLLAAAVTASAPAAMAQGGANQLCIYQGPTQRSATTPSSVPIWKVTTSGQGTSSAAATQDGKMKWSYKVKQDFGQPFSNVGKARFLHVSCSSTGSPFTPKYVCWVTAQPCN